MFFVSGNAQNLLVADSPCPAAESMLNSRKPGHIVVSVMNVRATNISQKTLQQP
jgi:hypothetical protein